MKRINIFIFLTLTLCFIFIPFTKVNASAETLQDLYDELANLKEKKAAAEGNKKLTNAQIAVLRTEINNTTSLIEQTKKDIKVASNEIEESKKKIAEKTEETKELLRFLQTSSGENIYLEYLFEAEDYTDFIYRFSVVNQLSEYNNNLMNELETLVNELEAKKIELANKQKALEEQQSRLSGKLLTLRANLANLESEGLSLDEEIEAKQMDIDYYESQGCGLNQPFSYCVANPYASGWNLPFIGGFYVSSEYGWRSYYINGVIKTDFHRGMDIGMNEWTPIYAAATGRVAYIAHRGSCGGNMIYIYHTVGGKKYTTVYMHLVSINTTEGAIVTPNTIIGYSGGGASTWWDYCSTGGHLHFQVANGNSVSAVNAYSFNPRDLGVFGYSGYIRR